MKNKIYKAKIEVPLCENTIQILYCKDDLERLFDYIGDDSYDESKRYNAVVIRDVITNDGHIFMLLSDLKLRTIIHECFHVVVRLLVPRDINLDNPSTEEIYAYFNAWITTEVLQKIKKWGKIT